MRIVPALDRGLRILALLAAQNGRLRVAEIVEALSLPRSATYELIYTLVANGMVQQYENGEVGLGHQALVLGSAYSRELDFGRLAQEISQEVMLNCEETVQIGVLDGRHVLYVARADSRRAVRLVSTVGVRLPAHCTALGKALLSTRSGEDLQALLAGVTLEALTEHSISDIDALIADLKSIRKKGVATEQCESNQDVACVAAPIWNAQGENVAAMSISVPVGRMDAQRREELIKVVMDGARQFSLRLGFVQRTDAKQVSLTN
jgi:DNA-binding IclR family transcriptional regulator